jgi:hypothetical protein
LRRNQPDIELTGPEGNLKRRVDAYLKKRKQAVGDVWYFKVHGGPYQRAGVLDYLLCVRGLFVAIELKVDTELSELQKRECRDIEQAGGRVAVCYTLDDVIQTVEWVARFGSRHAAPLQAPPLTAT